MASIDLDDIQNKFINNLKNDAELSDGLPEQIQIYKGVRRIKNVSHKFALFVYRERNSEPNYHLGSQQYDVEPILNLVCLIRSPFDPEKIEEYTNNFASNVLNHIFEHKIENGYWAYAKHMGSTAVTIRDDKQQDYEIEIIPVKLGIFNITAR